MIKKMVSCIVLLALTLITILANAQALKVREFFLDKGSVPYYWYGTGLIKSSIEVEDGDTIYSCHGEFPLYYRGTKTDNSDVGVFSCYEDSQKELPLDDSFASPEDNEFNQGCPPATELIRGVGTRDYCALVNGQNGKDLSGIDVCEDEGLGGFRSYIYLNDGKYLNCKKEPIPNEPTLVAYEQEFQCDSVWGRSSHIYGEICKLSLIEDSSAGGYAPCPMGTPIIYTIGDGSQAELRCISDPEDVLPINCSENSEHEYCVENNGCPKYTQYISGYSVPSHCALSSVYRPASGTDLNESDVCAMSGRGKFSGYAIIEERKTLFCTDDFSNPVISLECPAGSEFISGLARYPDFCAPIGGEGGVDINGVNICDVYDASSFLEYDYTKSGQKYLRCDRFDDGVRGVNLRQK
ncbi:hypothetical protein [Marinibactrum halimedae]|uniref:Uncharacterized protein n=1 Tax=Marinibactrum halimedae TaxID=1444977 RepID=A0AA37TBT5_9GAMM|nr:hypothetical protein [Marinibactrum halimedae]MCD9461190.1 hypothetical protein [Marinibactrum halimedae]GLS26187.1 hypothetical protein GCM10007877_19020 [Marinibactrum halimedae]